MADIDYQKTFSCPRCGAVGNIYLVKVAGGKTIIKQRCPTHGGRAFKVPTKEKDNYIEFIRDGVFRCYKCGGEAKQSYRRDVKPWIIIKTSCPTHGALTSQKIWDTIYAEIASEEATKMESPQIEPSQEGLSQTEPIQVEERKFCPNCGAKLEEAGRFCGECGSKLT